MYDTGCCHTLVAGMVLTLTLLLLCVWLLLLLLADAAHMLRAC